MSTAVELLGASFFATHYASAADAAAGRARPFVPPEFRLLTGRARRFTSLVTQMHLEVCGGLPAVERPSAVFATCHGEIQTAAKLIADFRDTGMVSSAQFALSVHNSPAGLYSLATGNTEPTTTITGANAVAAGWLEAAVTAAANNEMVLLSIADEPVPAVFERPDEPLGFAAAFLLAPPCRGGQRAALSLTTGEPPDASTALSVLARVVCGAQSGAAVAVSLGFIRPGHTLTLELEPRP